MEVLLYVIKEEPKNRINIPILRDIPSFYGGFWNATQGTPYLRTIENGGITLSFIDAQQTPDANYDCLVEAFLRKNSQKIGLLVLKGNLKEWEKRLKECDSYMREKGKGNLEVIIKDSSTSFETYHPISINY